MFIEELASRVLNTIFLFSQLTQLEHFNRIYHVKILLGMNLILFIFEHIDKYKPNSYVMKSIIMGKIEEITWAHSRATARCSFWVQFAQRN